MPSFAGMVRKGAELPVPGKRKGGRPTEIWMNIKERPGVEGDEGGRCQSPEQVHSRPTL